MKAAVILGTVVWSAFALALHDYVLHESRANTRASWKRGNPLDPNTIIPVRIGLSQSNLDSGHDMLMEVMSIASSGRVTVAEWPS